MAIAQAVVWITLGALCLVPAATAGPLNWVEGSAEYHSVTARCHTSTNDECSPDCPPQLPAGIVCMATNYPIIVYEDFVGDF